MEPPWYAGIECAECRRCMRRTPDAEAAAADPDADGAGEKCVQRPARRKASRFWSLLIYRRLRVEAFQAFSTALRQAVG